MVAKLILPGRYNSALAGGSLRQAVNYKQLGDINLAAYPGRSLFFTFC